jgi:hypothetical protein
MNRHQIETFEKDIYNIITKCLSEDETIEFDLHFDFRVPNGVKKLNWEKNTVIEIKYRFIYNSFERIRYSFDLYSPPKLIIVVIEENSLSLRLNCNATMTGRAIEVLSYNDLIQKAKTEVFGQNDSKQTESLGKLGNKYQKEKDDNVLIKLKHTIKNNKDSIFMGAGVSASAGVVTWDNLLEQLCVKKEINKIDSDIDSVIKGRYIIDEYKKKGKIPDEFYYDMRGILYANTHSSKLIESIANLINTCRIESIISYNYDDLVEQEVNKTNRCYPVYAKTRPVEGNNFYIYHVHGFISKNGIWSDIVLGEREYHKIYQESYNWGNVEQLHALCRSSCLFIGLSMTDPNLRRLIDISIDGGEVEPVHFAFLRRIEYNIQLTEKILRGFGINCVWYDRYEDLPNLINALTK